MASDQPAHRPVLEVLQSATAGLRDVVDDVRIVTVDATLALDTPDDHDSYPFLWRCLQ
jgi:hypothetical protein